jgi:exportin-T
LQSGRPQNGTVGCVTTEKPFILNKVAQLFVNACLADYPRRWPTFFDDLIRAMALGSAVVDLCMRILMALDGEVVDRDIVHSDQVCIE